MLSVAGHRRPLAEPVGVDLTRALREDGVGFVTGEVLVATGAEPAGRILDLITEAIGDAENGHAMFDLVDSGVTPADAVPASKARSDPVPGARRRRSSAAGQLRDPGRKALAQAPTPGQAGNQALPVRHEEDPVQPHHPDDATTSDLSSQVAAGEAAGAMMRAATATGMACCLISCPDSRPSNRHPIRRDPGGPWTHARLALQIGWAPVGARTIPASLRRPLCDVMVIRDEGRPSSRPYRSSSPDAPSPEPQTVR